MRRAGSGGGPIPGNVNTLEFRYEPNFGDNFHGVLLGFWGTPAGAGRSLLMCVAFGAVFFGGLLLLQVPPAFAAFLSLLASIGWGVLFSVGFGAWVAAALTRRQRAIGPARILVTGEGLERVTRSASVKRSWDGIARIVETHRAFLLFEGADPVFAIEKSAVKTEDELGALRELLRERVPVRE